MKLHYYTFEIYSYLSYRILHKIFFDCMDKFKIHAVFENEFSCETNASETTRKITSVFGEGSTSHSTVSFHKKRYAFTRKVLKKISFFFFGTTVLIKH